MKKTVIMIHRFINFMTDNYKQYIFFVYFLKTSKILQEDDRH